MVWLHIIGPNFYPMHLFPFHHVDRLPLVHFHHVPDHEEPYWPSQPPNSSEDVPNGVFRLPVLTSRSLFLGIVPIGTIWPFLVPIWSLFYQTGPYSAKIVVRTPNIIPTMPYWQLIGPQIKLEMCTLSKHSYQYFPKISKMVSIWFAHSPFKVSIFK